MSLFSKIALAFRKLKKVKNSKLEDYYFTSLFGVSKKNVSKYFLRETDFKNLPAPIFFLSTGRCGTNWFEKLLSHDKNLCVFHEPTPNLAIQGKRAFELNSGNLSANENELLKEVFLSAREHYLRHSFKADKQYVETNNHLTFLASQIAEIIPHAKFVHLYRHPGEFVTSAMNREFFSENNHEDIKRIKPLTAENWEGYNQIEKCSWLWNETNLFIEEFKLKNDNVFSFNFNELSKEKVMGLISFLDLNISENSIESLLTVKSNVQKTKRFNKYENWEGKDQLALKNICKELSDKYNYKL